MFFFFFYSFFHYRYLAGVFGLTNFKTNTRESVELDFYLSCFHFTQEQGLTLNQTIVVLSLLKRLLHLSITNKWNINESYLWYKKELLTLSLPEKAFSLEKLKVYVPNQQEQEVQSLVSTLIPLINQDTAIHESELQIKFKLSKKISHQQKLKAEAAAAEALESTTSTKSKETGKSRSKSSASTTPDPTSETNNNNNNNNNSNNNNNNNNSSSSSSRPSTSSSSKKKSILASARDAAKDALKDIKDVSKDIASAITPDFIEDKIVAQFSSGTQNNTSSTPTTSGLDEESRKLLESKEALIEAISKGAQTLLSSTITTTNRLFFVFSETDSHIFSVLDAKKITEFTSSTYFQHFRLYQAVFLTMRKVEPIKIPLPLETALEPLPLSQGMNQEQWNQKQKEAREAAAKEEEERQARLAEQKRQQEEEEAAALAALVAEREEELRLRAIAEEEARMRKKMLQLQAEAEAGGETARKNLEALAAKIVESRLSSIQDKMISNWEAQEQVLIDRITKLEEKASQLAAASSTNKRRSRK